MQNNNVFLIIPEGQSGYTPDHPDFAKIATKLISSGYGLKYATNTLDFMIRDEIDEEGYLDPELNSRVTRLADIMNQCELYVCHNPEKDPCIEQEARLAEHLGLKELNFNLND